VGVNAEPRLELRDVSLAFGSTRALAHVSFTLAAGEVHVLAGENGAGKSTLIKILSGVHQAYSGELRIDGEQVRLRGPGDARARGIATIHQELSLVPVLSTTDNFLIGRPGPAFGGISRAGARVRAMQALAELGLDLDPDLPVEQFPLAERQLIEIARALDADARVLVMDEPTSALSEREAARLFSVVERLRAAGTSVLYISHRMQEIYRLADRISVLRDGERVLTSAAAELSRDALVQALLGRTLALTHSTAKAAPRAERLALSQLRTRTGSLAGVDLTLGHGEIVGLSGVLGAGASELLHALFGNLALLSGTLRLDGAGYVPSTPRAAMARGIALVASDREHSVLRNLSVVENGTLSSLERYSHFGFVARRDEHAAVAQELAPLRLKAASLDAAAETLSGGNQQKVALVRCLLTRPRLLLLDDPTRGIDLGAKHDLYQRLRELTATGTSVLIYSSELDELCQLCDRVFCLFRGRIRAEFSDSELEPGRLLAAIMGAAS
jgi:ABC-type sugar transport system ATPase subunit